MNPRIAAIAAAVAGAASILGAALQVAHTQPDSHWQAVDVLIEALFALALLAGTVALHGLPTRLQAGRVARIGAIVGQVGLVLLLVTALASIVALQDALEPLFPLALLVGLIGLLVLGIAGAMTGRPRLLAIVPFLGLLLSVVAPLGGEFLFGIAWLVVGAGLAIRPRAVESAAMPSEAAPQAARS